MLGGAKSPSTLSSLVGAPSSLFSLIRWVFGLNELVLGMLISLYIICKSIQGFHTLVSFGAYGVLEKSDLM